MEHYQSSSTPKSSLPKIQSVTPSVNKGNSLAQEKDPLPVELSTNCSHGMKVCESFFHLPNYQVLEVNLKYLIL